MFQFSSIYFLKIEFTQIQADFVFKINTAVESPTKNVDQN